MYDFWVIVVPRILAVGLLVMLSVWGGALTVRTLTSVERVHLLKRSIDYEAYRKRSRAALQAAVAAAATQLPDELIVEIVQLTDWKPGKPISEKPYS